MLFYYCFHFLIIKDTEAGILSEAQDWQLLVDPEKQLRLPQHIVSTTLRPDILLVSEAT